MVEMDFKHPILNQWAKEIFSMEIEELRRETERMENDLKELQLKLFINKLAFKMRTEFLPLENLKD